MNKSKVLTIFTLSILLSAIFHGINMFGYPYFENDEGTYLAQAWSILSQGKLAPYTYWYDHAPAGWMFISVWLKLTGGLFTFGPSMYTGRVFMLVIHVLASALVFYITYKLTKSSVTSFLSVAIFSLTPLGIYFQRRLLLDNIMIFWVLLSIAILFKDKLKLSDVMISSFIFGVAVLTKENAVFFYPIFIYLVYHQSHKHMRSFALSTFLIVSGFIISSYVLYANLKGEFLPSATGDHVSLVGTLKLQLSRGNTGKYFWQQGSDFYINFSSWLTKDPITIVVGIASTFVGVMLGLRKFNMRIASLFSLFFWIFLIRGSLVIDFYIIPLIPLLAINIAVVFNELSNFLSFNRFSKLFLRYTIIVIFPLSLAAGSFNHLTQNETAPQIEAVKYIKENLPEDANIAIDFYAYLDLQYDYYNNKEFRNAEWFWKITHDPEIRGKLNDDWKNIDYILLTHETLKHSKAPDPGNQILAEAFDNSDQIVLYGPNNPNTYLDFNQKISTNGDWTAIYKIKTTNQIMLDKSWDYYKENFIHSYGQIIDPATKNTTSEGQAYGLLRAVWSDDQKNFDGILIWTQDHMQYRTQDKLFSWLWNNEKQSLDDTNSASDADLDIALSLILAYRRWGEEKYLVLAKVIIDDIWENEVVEVGGKYILLSSASSTNDDGYLVNPSYFSPATYRLFAKYNNYPWEELANNTYEFLDTTPGLPTNWLLVTPDGEITSASKYISSPDTDNYGFDAFRLYWRISLDYDWNKSPEAEKILRQTSAFFTSEWLENGKIYSIYSTSGDQVSNYTSLATYTAPLLVFKLDNPELANQIYQEQYLNKFNFEKGYWGDQNNYYDQNWAWLALAEYNNKLSVY